MWFSYDGEVFEVFSTEEEARKSANKAMASWDDFADQCGEWDHLSTRVCYGRVTHAVKVQREVSAEYHTLEPIDDTST